MKKNENRYSPESIEPHWQSFWEEKALYRARGTGRKAYVLEMFPYTSARIHMGHVRNYTIGDVIARQKMMAGFSVLHPIGYDSFGLPAENAAIKQGEAPAAWTSRNVATISRQLKQLGLAYDWERLVVTCDPEYYRWNQYFFLLFHRHGLVYRKKSPANFCPDCRTVLANEQVVDDGCWRCGEKVIRKELDQWFFRTSRYADELLDESGLAGWPERVRIMQANWIGRSTGAEILFALPDLEQMLPVFTTRADTLFGATYVVLSPDHPMAGEIIAASPRREALAAFAEKWRRAGNAPGEEKEGIDTGLETRNPVNGEMIPLWFANYVLAGYGTGAIMAVPAHDQRDFEFARAYRLPVREVVARPDANPGGEIESAWEGPGVLVDSGSFSGRPSEEARAEITAWLTGKKLARETVNYRLRDWCISRQRYWGTPIPIIYCDRCGAVPVPEDQLPITLPDNVRFTGRDGSPLSIESFVGCTCPACGAKARRETDTMDTFVDSSWYFLRFASGDRRDKPFDRREVDFWMPVDQYIGGIEHAILHLLYSRFFVKALRDIGLLSLDEPFRNLLCQGMVIKDGAKMSKSRGNVVDPEEMIRKYGADTVRLFTLFAAPPELDLEWSEAGVEGAWRFLNRVWKLTDKAAATAPSAGGREAENEFRRLRNATIDRVTRDVTGTFQFNTAIARLMEFTNYLAAAGERKTLPPPLLAEGARTLVLLLAPFCPHVAEELWQRLGGRPSVFSQPWPESDPEAPPEESAEFAIQVNGRVKGRITVPAGAGKAEIEAAARADERVAPLLDGRAVSRVIVVPGRLVNIVVK